MTKLETINAEDLQNRTYEPTHFLVDELIPEGLHILAGAPKIGKSWLALWLCLCVSQGQPLWNFATTQGEVLYLSLEDSFQRIQTRLFDLTEDAPPTLHFAIMADTLRHGLEQQIEQFLAEHPTTKLVVIDTLQRVRSAGGDSNLYANDYQDVGLLKQLADQHHIAILLIHHLRKLHDDDPMNMISGSTGLSGAADSAFVLQKNARSANAASLHCTGRDIPDRTLKLELGEDDHIWKLLEDSKTCSGASKISTLQLVHLFSELLRANPTYLGSPSALSAKIDPDGSLGIVKAPKTKAGNRYVYFSAEMESLLREYEAFCAAETEHYDRRKQTKDDYVFRRKGMKLPMTPSTFTWRFKKILKANDLPTGLNVHSLRHTAASLFIASGTDVGTVAGLLGHSQPSTTLDIYTHAFDKNKKAASQIMQSNLEI